jgi:DNA-binding XRE family transcriptional regulator
MTFGERMRAKRKAAGLTLVELGEKVGYSHAALSALETGRSNGGRGCAKAVKAFLGLRGGKMAKTKKPAKAPRKPKAAPEAMERADATLTALGLLLGGLTRLADSVDRMAEAMAPKPPDLSLVPSVAEQRARTEAMTAGIAQNGLRRPLASNSLDHSPGVPVLPVTRAVGSFDAG